LRITLFPLLDWDGNNLDELCRCDPSQPVEAKDSSLDEIDADQDNDGQQGQCQATEEFMSVI
jgi:hypothetical protein